MKEALINSVNTRLQWLKAHWDQLAFGAVVLAFVWQLGVAIQPAPSLPLAVKSVNNPVLVASAHQGQVVKKSRAKKAKKMPHIININLASQADFEQLPSVGPVKAKRIVTYRNQFGAFKTVEDLIKVSGIGPKTLAKFKPYLTL